MPVGAPSTRTVTYIVDTADLARRGRIGAYVTHSRHDPRDTTAAARAAFNARFEREVDPDRILPEAERRRRAAAARKAHYARLALASSAARARKRKRQGLAPVAATSAAPSAAPSAPLSPGTAG